MYYIGLAPRLYSLVWISGCGEFRQEMCKAKGLPSRAVKGEGFEAYKEQLENPKETFVTYHKIMRDRLKTYIGETTRRGVCAVDTKTFSLDEHRNVPLGHWRINHTAQSISVFWVFLRLGRKTALSIQTCQQSVPKT